MSRRRPASSNTVRLIAGELGGRKIRFPDARGLRPTADRTRETLFNWLANDIEGSRCLDLFAGSGALGFEAVSRGAADVKMMDASGSVVRQLQENASLLSIEDKVEIARQKAATYLAGYEKQESLKPFNIVFIDPPFADEQLQSVVNLLFSSNCLADGAKVYIERDVKQAMPLLPANCKVIRDKKAGQVAFTLLEYYR
jgi:16S rRNA (guanine966-N2)-methyltransferase